MSCIAVIRTEPQIVFASDGIAYRKDGLISGLCSKFIPIIELECVIGNIGIGGLSTALRHRIGQRFDDFDHLLDNIVVEFVHTFKEQGRLHIIADPGIAPTATMAIGGWSRSRERFETYKIHSFRKPAADAVTGEETFSEPWTLHRMPENYCSNWPGAELYEQFGLTEGKPMHDTEMAIRLVCANRPASKVVGTNEFEGVPYAVGGFVHLTVLSRTDAGEPHLASWIAHRWPDKPGTAFDPTLGEALPAFEPLKTA